MEGVRLPNALEGRELAVPLLKVAPLGPSLVLQGGHPMLFMAIQPGADGAPGESIELT